MDHSAMPWVHRDRRRIFCDVDVENAIHNIIFSDLIACAYVRDLFSVYSPGLYIAGVGSTVATLLGVCVCGDQLWIKSTRRDRCINKGAGANNFRSLPLQIYFTFQELYEQLCLL